MFLFRQKALEAFFQDMKKRLESMTWEEARQLKQMLRDLNELLEERLRSLRGFGPYAAASYMLLAGHTGVQVVDSWATGRARVIHGRAMDADALRRYYVRHGRWKGLVAWFDLMGPDSPLTGGNG